MKFEEVNNIMNDIRNDNYDKEKLLEALEDYKWLIEFKPFKKLVNTQPISTEELYNACIVYSRWYYYTKCNVGLQKILFVDGWRKENVEDCEHPRIPILTNKKYGFALDEDAWAKCIEDRINKELERYKGLD